MIKRNIVLLLLVLGLFSVPTEGKTLKGETNQIETVSNELIETQIHMNPAELKENLPFNVNKNSGFEEADAYGAPLEYSRYAESYRDADLAYQGPEVSNGSYAASVKAEGTNFSGGVSYIIQYLSTPPYAFLSEGQQLDCYYNMASNPDAASGAFHYIVLELFDSVITKRLRYHFTNTGTYSNDTDNAVFILDVQPIEEWHYFYRNVSRDYEEAFGAIPVNMRISTVGFYINSAVYATGIAELLVDSVRVLNKTGSNYMNTNWDFELGTGENWGSYKSSPGDISLTLDHTEGEKALNLSCTNIVEGGSNTGQAYVNMNYDYPDGQFATDYDQSVFEFDWKYNDQPAGGSNQRAYLYLQLQNTTHTIYINYVIGRADDLRYTEGSNSSQTYYIHVDDFGSRNSWQHQRIDLYDLFEEKNINDITVRRSYFYVRLGSSEDSFVQLLVDDFTFYSDLFKDGGFEQDWHTNTFTGWYTPYPKDNANLTSDARSGKWAANLTSHSSYETVYLQNSFTPQNIVPGVSTNFWWKVDQSSSSYSSAHYALRFEGGYILYYIIAASESFSPTNTTFSCYFFVDGYNDTFSWMNLKRELTSDLAFLGGSSYNLSDVYLQTFSDDGIMSVRFDDTFFTEIEPPVINSVSLEKTPVNYYEQATVIVEAVDASSEIGEVNVYYRNEVDWIAVETTLVGENYQVTLPMFPYGEVIQFYVNASDVFGNYLIDDNLGAYYTYSVNDDIDPLIEIIGPADGLTIVGDTIIEVNTEDVGSDIAYVEYYANLSLIGTVLVAPFNMEWDSRMIANGTYSITAIAYDNAGNFVASDAITLIVDNDDASPLFSQIYLNPTIPQYDQIIEVLASAFDSNTILNVTLFYKIGANAWYSAAMLRDGFIFRGDISAASYNTEVLYYLKAYDEFDQVSSAGTELEPLSYTVTDLIDPILTVDRLSASNSVIGTIDFTISGSDEGSGISSIEIRVDNEVVLQESSVPQDYSWDTSDYDNEEHTLLFILTDVAGNSAELEVIYSTDNPEGFLESAQFKIDEWIENYGIIIGAGGVILLWGIAQLILRRRKTST